MKNATKSRHDGQLPRLHTIPCTQSLEEANQKFRGMCSVWSLLSGYGQKRLMQDGWRGLGLGLVHVADPAFEVLVGGTAVAWATLDARDGWNQTILDIARRQRGWFSDTDGRVLDALDAAKPTLFEVESHQAPRLVLRGVCDGALVEVHARFDRGAYPAGSLLVCRVVRHEGLNLSLCSTVVSRTDAGALVADGRIASGALVGLCMKGAVRAIDEARVEEVDAIWATLGPAALRRVTRAAQAFHIAFSRSSARMFRHTDRDGRLLYAEPGAGRGYCLTVEPASSQRRIRASWMPVRAASPIDRALAVQAGVSPLPLGILRLETASGASPGHEECKEVVRACASAVGALKAGGLDRAA